MLSLTIIIVTFVKALHMYLALSCAVGTIIISVLQMRKLRHSEAQDFALTCVKPVFECMSVSRANLLKQYKEMNFFIANSFHPTFREVYNLLMGRK